MSILRSPWWRRSFDVAAGGGQCQQSTSAAVLFALTTMVVEALTHDQLLWQNVWNNGCQLNYEQLGFSRIYTAASQRKRISAGVCGRISCKLWISRGCLNNKKNNSSTLG
jgi:hypothetical protein